MEGLINLPKIGYENCFGAIRVRGTKDLYTILMQLSLISEPSPERNQNGDFISIYDVMNFVNRVEEELGVTLWK